MTIITDWTQILQDQRHGYSIWKKKPLSNTYMYGVYVGSQPYPDCTIGASMWPYQRSLLSFRMRSRSSKLSCASSSVDLMVVVSCGLTLQICLIIALSFRCRLGRLSFVNGQVSLAWRIAFRLQALYTQPGVLKKRWWEERNGISSLKPLPWP